MATRIDAGVENINPGFVGGIELVAGRHTVRAAGVVQQNMVAIQHGSKTHHDATPLRLVSHVARRIGGVDAGQLLNAALVGVHHQGAASGVDGP